MRSATQPNTTAAKVAPTTKCTHNFATTNLVLLPGLEPGSKSLIPQKKKKNSRPADQKGCRN